MDSCYICDGSERLKRVFAFNRDTWEDGQGVVFFATPQHAREHNFCRHCIRTFSKCQYCGDTAAWTGFQDDQDWPHDVCANPYKTCWPQYWDAVRNASGNPNNSAAHFSSTLRDQAAGSHPVVDSFVELWPGDGSDPIASSSSDDEASSGDDDAFQCYACNARFAANLAATYHGNDATYCLECFKQRISDGTFGGTFA